MTKTVTGSAPPALTPLQWTICGVAALGFAFDTYELLMLPLIVRPALAELLGVESNSLAVNSWVGTMQYVPAVAGGIFGLIGGYLTDLFGRRRVLVWSILIYAFSALAAGFTTSVEWLLFWRCCTFVGVCVEFVAAVAWLSELFTDPVQRERVVGYTQAFGSFGGIMVTAAYYLVVTYGQYLPEVRGGHEAWRYTLMSGVIPAIPLIIIRPFLPESPAWEAKKRAGTLRRPSFAALFTPEFRRTTIVTTIMMAAVYATAFGAIQQMPRVVPGLEQVRTLATHCAGADDQRRAVLPGDGRTGRPRRPCLSRSAYRQPAKAAPRVPISRHRAAARGIPAGAVGRPASRPVGHLHRGADDDRANELLGELPAARLPDALTRHRRELCRQRGRPHDRHVRRVHHRSTGHCDARGHSPDPAGVCLCPRRHGGVRDQRRRQLLAP